MHRWALLVALLALTSLACSENPTFKRSECWFPIPASSDREVECGFIKVPEKHQGGGEKIELAVVRISRGKQFRTRSAVFYLQGGPGGGLTESAPFFIQSVAPILASDRDLVLVDQRGTGLSSPFLGCPPPSSQNISSAQYLLECRQAMIAQGVDLSAFNSVENAADIDAVRRVLGYPRMVLYGSSYGTLLAQHVARDFPESVESMILDAPLPKDRSYLAELPASAQGALDAVFESCANDPLCAPIYPNLAQTFYTLIAQLNVAPYVFDVSVFPEAPTNFKLDVDGFVSSVLVDGLLFLGLGAEVPRAIYALRDAPTKIEARQELKEILRFLLRLNGSGGDSSGFADAMFYSTLCAESGVFGPEAINLQGVRPEISEVYRDRASSILDECRVWNVPALPPDRLAPITTGVPTLCLAGAFDPRTPPRFCDYIIGDAASPRLSAATKVSFPRLGHGVLLANECVNTIVAQFLQTPTNAPNAACVGGSSRPFNTPVARLPLDRAQVEMLDNLRLKGIGQGDLRPRLQGLR